MRTASLSQRGSATKLPLSIGSREKRYLQFSPVLNSTGADLMSRAKNAELSAIKIT